MLAYAANAPRLAERRRSPRALLVIVGAHAAVLAAVMTAKMDIVREQFGGTDVTFVPAPIPEPQDPPPPQPQHQRPRDPAISRLDTPEPLLPIDPVGPLFNNPPLDIPATGPTIGTGTEYVPQPPIHAVVRKAARFATPDWALKPPYPHEKRQAEEEATLKLRLSIDDQGRVIAVEPVGNVDPVFLAAARKHLIARWRYKPATEDGRPVHSSTVVTLRFELEA